MPTLFSYIFLFSWPIITIVLFIRTSAEKAIIWSLTASYLLLPVRITIDLPGLPPLDKINLPCFATFIICFIIYPKKIKLPQSNIIRFFFFCMLLFPFFTYYTNREALVYGTNVITGLALNDFLSEFFLVLTTFIFPFILGYQFLNTNENHKLFLQILIISGLLYTVPMLWEIRMSPQLHKTIYGFFPHIFLQQMRYGGYRPVVFIGHGGPVAFYTLSVLLASIILYKVKSRPLHKIGLLIIGYLAVILIFCKTLAAILYAILIAPFIQFTQRKLQLKICFAVAIIVLSYPILRTENLFPVDTLLDIAESIDTDRAFSLAFRFDHEDLLLEKANIKKYFGWGSWGRNRVYDPITGENLSVIDGYWILIMGKFGYFGYFTLFGLLCYPAYSLYINAKKYNFSNISLYTTGISLIYAIKLIDFLPNASFTTLTILMTGSLAGMSETIKSQKF